MPDAEQPTPDVTAAERRHRSIGWSALAAVAAVAVVSAWANGLFHETPDLVRDWNKDRPGVVAADDARELDCPEGSRLREMEYLRRAHADFTALMEAYGVADPPFGEVNRTAGTVSFRRVGEPEQAVGTIPPVDQVLSWSGDPDSSWAAEGKSWCARPSRGTRPATVMTAWTGGDKVSLDIGHCWIEPFEVDGSRWEPIAEDQGGDGGELPKGFVGKGEAWPAGDVAFYRDASGALLTLVPEGDPWADERDFCA